MKALGLGVAIAFGIAGSAYAADIGVIQPVVSPEYQHPVHQQTGRNWTGFHIGLDVGGQFDFVNSNVYAYNTNSVWAGLGSPNDQDLGSNADLGARNWFISADVGADYQIPGSQFVVGAFAGYDFALSKGSASHNATAVHDIPTPAGCPNSFACATTTSYKEVANTVTYGDAWGVGVRGGVLVNPNTLVYALGGYGQKHISASSSFDFDYYNGQSFEGGLSGGGWQPGWFVGGGVEAAVGKHTTLSLEYRMAQYKGFSASCTLPDCGQSTPGGYNFNSHSFDVGDTTSHTVRARLSLWFGGHQQEPISVGY